MAKIFSVSKNRRHLFSKVTCSFINLIEGQGVEGDAHCGITVKHRSRVKIDPTQPNLRQVHLIHIELIKDLNSKGFHILPGAMGENITTEGLDLLSLPTNTCLKIGSAEIRITGLRNPCAQLDNYQKGLTAAVLDKDEQGNLIRKAGLMGIVLKGGIIKPGDHIETAYPTEPRLPLEVV